MSDEAADGWEWLRADYRDSLRHWEEQQLAGTIPPDLDPHSLLSWLRAQPMRYLLAHDGMALITALALSSTPHCTH